LPEPIAGDRSRRQSLAGGGNLAGACRVPLLRARDCPQLLAAHHE